MLEYVRGIPMNHYLSTRKPEAIKNFELCQFYLSILLIILDYLNKKKICHRDLKPENISIDQKGYLKVLDFGASVEINNCTYTITGTPHYMAPEVLLGCGYSYSCDYWSVGIILFYCYYNYFPFGMNPKDAMDIYKETIANDLVFPQPHNEKDSIINQITNDLLIKKTSARVCSLREAKTYEIFKNFNWNKLEDMQIKPPFIPNLPPLNKIKDCHLPYLEFVKKIEEDELYNSFFYESNSVDDEYDDNSYKSDWYKEF